jgi:hypothetical protein
MRLSVADNFNDYFVMIEIPMQTCMDYYKAKSKCSRPCFRNEWDGAGTRAKLLGLDFLAQRTTMPLEHASSIADGFTRNFPTSF